MTDYKFTFLTEADYNTARFTGSINTYDMVRVKQYHSSDHHGVESTHYHDYPVHSKEELSKLVAKLQSEMTKFEVYQSKHYYDIQDYD